MRSPSALVKVFNLLRSSYVRVMMALPSVVVDEMFEPRKLVTLNAEAEIPAHREISRVRKNGRIEGKAGVFSVLPRRVFREMKKREIRQAGVRMSACCLSGRIHTRKKIKDPFTVEA